MRYFRGAVSNNQHASFNKGLYDQQAPINYVWTQLRRQAKSGVKANPDHVRFSCRVFARWGFFPRGTVGVDRFPTLVSG